MMRSTITETAASALAVGVARQAVAAHHVAAHVGRQEVVEEEADEQEAQDRAEGHATPWARSRTCHLTPLMMMASM